MTGQYREIYTSHIYTGRPDPTSLEEDLSSALHILSPATHLVMGYLYRGKGNDTSLGEN